jgi:sulfur transfer complex TusBCD TusB component (DsrH family)
VKEADLSAPPADAPATRPDAPPAAQQDRHLNPVGHPKRVVFLCNASASVKTKFALIKKELSGAIDGLKPDQQFDVVLWQDGLAIAFQRDALAPATEESKKRCAAFVERTIARGNKNALPAISLAFKLKPDLIHLLTDSDFPDNDAVLKKVRELNKAGADGEVPTTVNTIAVVNEKGTDTSFLKLLETIAKENGGRFSKVTETDLKN